MFTANYKYVKGVTFIVERRWRAKQSLTIVTDLEYDCKILRSCSNVLYILLRKRGSRRLLIFRKFAGGYLAGGCSTATDDELTMFPYQA